MNQIDFDERKKLKKKHEWMIKRVIYEKRIFKYRLQRLIFGLDIEEENTIVLFYFFFFYNNKRK